MKLSPQQEQALASVNAWLADPKAEQIFYLAGYAGSGKTSISVILSADAGDVAFAAFTGKAALVMRSKGCAGASTIHSLIYSPKEDRGGNMRFVLNKDSAAATADLIIIDEVSMVGEELGQDLLSFKTKVLVLGDPAQLPPVGGEGYFTKREPDFMLTEIHRQAEGNPIIALATTVREGGRLELGVYGQSLVLNRNQLGQKMVLGADQIICGKNATRRSLNKKIRGLLGRSGRFEVGDRVVALRNNSELGLLNGSLWEVAEIEYSDGDETDMIVSPLDEGMGTKSVSVKTHHAWLDGNESQMSWKEQKDYQPFDYGYVLSCHKSQGSQWESVLIFDESAAFREDRNRWLYTAITRAADRVVVVI